MATVAENLPLTDCDDKKGKLTRRDGFQKNVFDFMAVADLN